MDDICTQLDALLREELGATFTADEDHMQRRTLLLEESRYQAHQRPDVGHSHPIRMTVRDRRLLTAWVSSAVPARSAGGRVVVRAFNATPVVISTRERGLTSRERLHRLGMPANLFEDAPGTRYPEYGGPDATNVCAVSLSGEDA